MELHSFEKQPAEPPSTLKVILLSAAVSLIVSCVPALATALLAVESVNQEAANRAYQNCVRANEGRDAAREELQLEILTETTLMETMPKSSPAYKILANSVKVKRDDLLPKVQERECKAELDKAAKNGDH